MKQRTRQSLGAFERRSWIEARLEADGAVSLSEAADWLGVSTMTIRRDLQELEERGTVRRVRGGARLLGPQTFAQRHEVASAAKSTIAAKLVDLIPMSGAIALDASSTVLRVTASLDRARDLHVLTNGPDTFAALQNLPGVRPLLTGGFLDDLAPPDGAGVNVRIPAGSREARCGRSDTRRSRSSRSCGRRR